MVRGTKYGVNAILSVAVLTLFACAARPPISAGSQPVTQPSVQADATSGDDASEPDASGGAATEAEATDDVEDAEVPCPPDMVLVETSAQRFCIDKYEASLVERFPDGSERPYAPYLPVDGHDVRAVSVAGVFPQGYISEVQAQDACAASEKYLCKPEEWQTACTGPDHTTFPYGNERRLGVCHDSGKSAVVAVFGAKAVLASAPPGSPRRPAAVHAKNASAATRSAKGHSANVPRARGTAAKNTTKRSRGKTILIRGAPRPTPKSTRRAAKKSVRPAAVDPGVWARLNDPGLGQVDGALSKTGDHPECVNAFGVFDMVGNLHEWVATAPTAPHGTFAGGYYLDTTINGEGCNYRTQAHAHDYHDYSTGFRCCAPAP